MNQLTKTETTFKSKLVGRMQEGINGAIHSGERVRTMLFALSPPSPHWHWIFHFAFVQLMRTAFVVCLTDRRLLIFKSSKTVWGAGRLREQLFAYDVDGFKLTETDEGRSAFLGPWRMVSVNAPGGPPLRLLLLEKLWTEEARLLRTQASA